MTRVQLIEAVVSENLASASQAARMTKADLEKLVDKDKGQEIEVSQVVVKPVEKIVEKKISDCDSCRLQGNKSQCLSCVNYKGV